MENKSKEQKLVNQSQEHRGVPSSESKATSALNADYSPCPDLRCNDHLGAMPIPQCVTAVAWAEKVVELETIAEAARDFMWDGENWEAYEQAKQSNSVAWPPEFLLLAQAVEKTYGAVPLDEPCKLCDAKTVATHDPDCPENPVYDSLEQSTASGTMSRPWRAEVGERLSDGSDCWVIDSEDGSVAEMACPKDVEQATAELIVAAVNAYSLTACAAPQEGLGDGDKSSRS